MGRTKKEYQDILEKGFAKKDADKVAEIFVAIDNWAHGDAFAGAKIENWKSKEQVEKLAQIFERNGYEKKAKKIREGYSTLKHKLLAYTKTVSEWVN